MSTDFSLSPLQTDDTVGLSWRVRQPAPAAPKRMLILLHGVGSNEHNLLDLADGVDADTLVVLPRGRLTLGSKQYAWFRVMFTAAGPNIVPEEAEHSRLALIRLVAHLQARYGVSARDTVIAGFSQGGILSASVALSAPERVAGFGLLAGRILPELAPMLASPERLQGLQGFIGHGLYDSKLPIQWAHRAEQLLTELGVAHAVRHYPIDHGISADMHADFVAWWRALA